MSVVLPIPGSPATQTTARLPLHAASQARRSRESASARPMNGGSLQASGFARNACLSGWRGGYRGSGRDEPIAPPRHSFDEARLPGIVVKRGPRSLMAVFNTESLTNWWPQT